MEVVVSSLVGVIVPLLLYVIQKINKFEKRLSNLEGKIEVILAILNNKRDKSVDYN